MTTHQATTTATAAEEEGPEEGEWSGAEGEVLPTDSPMEEEPGSLDIEHPHARADRLLHAWQAGLSSYLALHGGEDGLGGLGGRRTTTPSFPSSLCCPPPAAAAAAGVVVVAPVVEEEEGPPHAPAMAGEQDIAESPVVLGLADLKRSAAEAELDEEEPWHPVSSSSLPPTQDAAHPTPPLSEEELRSRIHMAWYYAGYYTALLEQHYPPAASAQTAAGSSDRPKLQAFRTNGIRKTMGQLLMLDQPKSGRLVGVDAMGNEYYENRDEIVGRDRWVLYAKWNNDATQVPPEWHQWMHRMTDDVPTSENCPRPFYAPTEHRENYTATPGAFKTYSTVIPKVTPWAGRPAQRG